MVLTDQKVVFDDKIYTVEFYKVYLSWHKPAPDQVCTECGENHIDLMGTQVERVVSITQENPDMAIRVDGQVGKAVVKKLQADLWEESNICNECYWYPTRRDRERRG